MRYTRLSIFRISRGLLLIHMSTATCYHLGFLAQAYLECPFRCSFFPPHLFSASSNYATLCLRPFGNVRNCKNGGGPFASHRVMLTDLFLHLFYAENNIPPTNSLLRTRKIQAHVLDFYFPNQRSKHTHTLLLLCGVCVCVRRCSAINSSGRVVAAAAAAAAVGLLV